MARRRVKTPEVENEMAGMLRWLVTYADCITLLLAVFIVMVASSSIEQKKFEEIMKAFKRAFGEKASVIKQQGQGMMQGPKNPSLIQHFTPVIGMTEKIEALRGDIDRRIKDLGLSDDVTTTITEKGIGITMQTEGEHALFDIGSAEIKQEFKPLLDMFTEKFIKIKNNIIIEGHTCDIPIDTWEFPSNWELSTRRATNVLRYFIEKQIPANRLSAAGYADTKPVVPNDSEENRKKNRRIEITILF